MQDLQTLISLLTQRRNIHISFLDLTGVLNTPNTSVGFAHRLHSKPFCDIAKSTDEGRRRCLRCKRCANKKAITTKRAFGGYCVYGLYEVAFPIVMNNTVVAVVYVGNAVIDEKKTQVRIESTCARSLVEKSELLRHLKECEYLDNPIELFQIAEIIADYIKAIYQKPQRQSGSLHWLVDELQRYAKARFWTDISLKELASEYHKNEKYLGRLFKKETGVEFRQYLISLRLEKAEKLLLTTDDKILDIALDCGFNNVSYFNRLFFQKHGVSPSRFRQG